MLESSFLVDDSRPASPRQRQQQQPSDIPIEGPPRRSLMDMIRIAGAVLIVCCFAGLLVWQWPNMAAVYRMLRSPSPQQQQQDQAQPSTPAATQKNAERFDPAAQPPVAAGAAVAQRVVLYEEDPGDPNGKRSVGSRGLAHGHRLARHRQAARHRGARRHRNSRTRHEHQLDAAPRYRSEPLPTSHTIEIMFKLPPDFPSGGISNVPGIWMKQAEQTQGTRSAGSPSRSPPAIS